MLYQNSYQNDSFVQYFHNFYGSHVDALPLAQYDYVLRQCKNCSLVYQEIVPDSQLMRALYDGYINSKDTKAKHLYVTPLSTYVYTAHEIAKCMNIVTRRSFADI